MAFKFALGQKVFIASNSHEVTVHGRTEFLQGKQPRYYIYSEEAIPGKNHGEDWINEDRLTDTKPVPVKEPKKKIKPVVTAEPVQKVLKSIRHGKKVRKPQE